MTGKKTLGMTEGKRNKHSNFPIFIRKRVVSCILLISEVDHVINFSYEVSTRVDVWSQDRSKRSVKKGTEARIPRPAQPTEVTLSVTEVNCAGTGSPSVAGYSESTTSRGVPRPGPVPKKIMPAAPLPSARNESLWLPSCSPRTSRDTWTGNRKRPLPGANS